MSKHAEVREELPILEGNGTSGPVSENPYSGIVCSMPKNATVYEGRSGKSCAMVNVTVPIPHAGCSIEATVYARLNTKAGSIEPEPAPSKGVTFIDEAGRFSFTEAVVNAVQSWPLYAKAFDRAEAILMGGPVVDNRLRLAPRLVKQAPKV